MGSLKVPRYPNPNREPPPNPYRSSDDPALRDILPDQPEARWPVMVGVDIGQQHDPSAYAVVEQVQRWLGPGHWRPLDASPYGHDPRRARWLGDRWVELETETVWLCHALARIQLGTRYRAVGKRIADVVCSPFLDKRTVDILIDATGVGGPVAEEVTAQITARSGYGRVAVHPMTITGSRELNLAAERPTVGKSYLASRLAALVEAQPRRIVLPAKHPEAEAMRRELKDYAIKVDQNAHAEYGALKVGQYDDLATALALACLFDSNENEARYIKFTSPFW